MGKPDAIPVDATAVRPASFAETAATRSSSAALEATGVAARDPALAETSETFARPPAAAPSLAETVAPTRASGLHLDATQDSLRPGSFADPHGATAHDGPALESIIFAEPGEPGRIDRFAVLRRLGAGGMGVVYAAYDEQLDRKLAIKVLRPEQVAGTHGRARMLREAQAMAQLSHPNVVQIYEVGEFAGQIFIAMEFVKGRSLKDWLGEPHPLDEILEVFVQAGHGLAAAHRQGLVHRDFKPDNVLLGEDRTARVLDFGLARSDKHGPLQGPDDDSTIQRIGHRASVLSADLTVDGMLVGTPAFMSPEQFKNEPVDWRSDQFSFCVALYGAAYGQPPFAGNNLVSLQMSVCTGALRPPPPDSKAPPWLFEALKLGLAVDPAARHPSMDTLLAALTPERAPARRWLWPVVTLVATSLAVLLTIVILDPGDPTEAELQTIARHTREGRDAALAMHWVYPPPDDLSNTAYNRVVLLDAIDGPAAEQADDAAEALRRECAGTLIALGDRHWDDPDTRPFARDYYAQALLFSPLDPQASARAGVTVGQLADLGERASSGEFYAHEIFAAEPLRILAEPDQARARERALAYASSPAHTAALAGLHFDAILRKAGLAPEPAPVEPATPPATLLAERPELPAPALAPDPPAPQPTLPAAPQPTPTTPPPPRVRPPRADGPPVTPTPPATPTPPVAQPDAPEPTPADREADRATSQQLAEEGNAAFKAGDSDRAEKLYKQALNLWQENTAALMGLSDVAFDDGRYAAAISYAEKAVRLAPKNADYQIRLGDAHFKAFHYDDARVRYEKAQQLGHPKAKERLARVEAELGK